MTQHPNLAANRLKPEMGRVVPISRQEDTHAAPPLSIEEQIVVRLENNDAIFDQILLKIRKSQRKSRISLHGLAPTRTRLIRRSPNADLHRSTTANRDYLTFGDLLIYQQTDEAVFTFAQDVLKSYVLGVLSAKKELQLGEESLKKIVDQSCATLTYKNTRLIEANAYDLLLKDTLRDIERRSKALQS